MGDGGASFLERLLPSEGVESPGELGKWRVQGRAPDGVAFPADLDQARAVLRVARERRCTVVPAGRGPVVNVPAPISPPTIVLSTGRWGGVKRYEPADLTLRVESGALLETLDGITREHGQWLALDPPGAPGRTVGSVLASGVGGPWSGSFGAPRDQVLGLGLLQGDGTHLRLGGDVVKNVAGFDLVRLVVGSRGSLGLITDASLRLHPAPEVDRTLTVPVEGVEEGVDALKAVQGLLLPLAAVELLLPSPGGNTGSAGGVLAVRIMGWTAAVDRMSEKVAESLGGWEAVSVLEEQEGRALFREAGAREASSSFSVRVTVPSGAREEAVAWVHGLARRGSSAPWVHLSGLSEVLRMGIAGGGGPDPKLPSPDVWTHFLRTAREGGAGVRVLHAPDELRWPGVPSGVDPVAHALSTGIRDTFDPWGILPGVPRP